MAGAIEHESEIFIKITLSLFEIYYEQWVTFLDVLSNSQWFGCYVKSAGMEAIIYPSILSFPFYFSKIPHITFNFIT